MNVFGESIPLSGLRGIIARRMLQSVTTKPHVTLDTEVEAAALLACQQRWTPGVQAQAGQKLTLTGLLVKLAALALRRYPRINGRVEADQVHLYPVVNVGVAVALGEGLVVPVIRDADRKPLHGIASELAVLVERARAGKLKPPDMMDATFTVSNLGTFGVTHFTPIINPPEIAVLGVGRITRVARRRAGDWIEVPQLNLSLSFDHAAIDGAQAAQYLQVLAAVLADPEELLAAESQGGV